MPAPNVTGQGVLTPIFLNAPGFLGLNTDASASILPPEWCTVAKNAVFDGDGRLSVRKGWSSQTTTPASGQIKHLHEFTKADGTTEIISSTDADIFTGVSAPSSIEGSLGVSDGNIMFVDLNDECIGLGIGTSSNPAIYTGSGDFTTVTVNSGTAPTSGIGTAAFGRLWVVDQDGFTIRYSALLDPTRWATGDGGGTIDMSRAWVFGQDEVVAIREFAGDLIIFGKKQIIVWTDGSGNDVGLNPTNIYISDTIPGLGAVSQFAMTHVDGDLWFLSYNGVRSLLRERTERTTPTDAISRNVEEEVKGLLGNQTTLDDITMVYSPQESFCILMFPQSNREIVFEAKPVLVEGRPVYRATTWTSACRAGLYRVNDRTLLASFNGEDGEIFKYDGYADAGSSYSFSYESGWLDLGEQAAQFIKFIKRLTSVVFVEANTTLTYTLKYDFASTGKVMQQAVSGGTFSEYNIAEYGTNGSRDPNDASLTAGEDVAEYSGGITLRTLRTPGAGGGQYIKVGVSLDNAGAQFALQQINLFATIGRIANV